MHLICEMDITAPLCTEKYLGLTRVMLKGKVKEDLKLYKALLYCLVTYPNWKI